MTDDTPAAPALRPSPRWWPLFAIVALVAIALVIVWLAPARQRQEQVMRSALALFAGAALALGWLLVFSRLRWRARLGGALLFFAVLASGGALFRIQGVSGDLVPIVVPRWQSAPVFASASPKTAAALPADFAGFPQFLGPTRDGVAAGPALARDWKTQPPELLWRVAVGEGYAGFAIAGTRALGLEQRGENEAVVCRDVRTGAELWAHLDTARYENPLGGIGPRTTPAIDGARVFALGATGHLRCLDLASGALRWQRDILRDAGAQRPEWGVASSPLVVGENVIVAPGGPGHSLAAYRAATGEPAWAAGDARAGYSSPQLATLLGEPQLLIFNHDGLAAHAPADGRVLWTYPWTNAAQHVSDPRVVAPDRLVVSTGYGAGADLVAVARDATGAWQAARVWHTQRLKSKFATLLARGGFLFGLDDGRLTCLDLATGEPRWKGERLGHGQLLRAGDLLVATAESGEVLLLEAAPDAPRELGRFPALEGKMWNPPALAPPLLLLRTERKAACYRLPLASERR